MCVVHFLPLQICSQKRNCGADCSSRPSSPPFLLTCHPRDLPQAGEALKRNPTRKHLATQIAQHPFLWKRMMPSKNHRHRFSVQPGHETNKYLTLHSHCWWCAEPFSRYKSTLSSGGDCVDLGESNGAETPTEPQ